MSDGVSRERSSDQPANGAPLARQEMMMSEPQSGAALRRRGEARSSIVVRRERIAALYRSVGREVLEASAHSGEDAPRLDVRVRPTIVSDIGAVARRMSR